MRWTTGARDKLRAKSVSKSRRCRFLAELDLSVTRRGGAADDERAWLAACSDPGTGEIRARVDPPADVVD